MKYTVLEMTQSILSDMDSDEVNSISDSAESRQVANIIRESYFNMLARTSLPEHQKIFNLDASADTSTPVLMTRPDNVVKTDWIKYNDLSAGIDSYSYVTILPFQQFKDYIDAFNSSESDVGSFNLDGSIFLYKNDVQPLYCTILSNYYIIFDAYNADLDSTLQSSKTMCFGTIVPEFDVVDNFTPDLDDRQFSLLLNEAKSEAFLELKQITNDQAVRDARRQWVSLQRNKQLANKPPSFELLPYYGRR